MQRHRIGQTALEVSEFGMGGAPLGGLFRAVDRASAMSSLANAWDAGLRYFDTAPFYGFGLSERRMGDFLQEKPRDSFVISTKVGRLLRPVPQAQVPDHSYIEPLNFTVDYDYSYDGIMRSVEFSYARLGLNRIDILFVHDIGVFTHGLEGNARHFKALMDGGLRALEELKSGGVISAYGLGVNETQICLDVLERAPLDVILLAGRYTLLDRSAEGQLLALCEARQTSLIVGGVFNSGVLVTGAGPGAMFNYAPASPEVLAKVRGMEAVAAQAGVPLAACALQFPLKHPRVASILIGTARTEELARNLAMRATPIAEDLWAEFEPYTIR